MKRLSDVAKIANVSSTTVARYLNKSGYVSKEKQQIIQKAIEAVGYTPNQTAKTLKNGHSNILGHIVPYSPVNTFFQKLSYSVNKMAYENEYQVLSVVLDDNSLPSLKAKVDKLLSYQVDGIIFSSFIQQEMDSEIRNYLETLNIPIVMIERPADCFGIDKVMINSAEGSYILTQALIDAGHKDIAYIGKRTKYSVEKERYKGFVVAMQENNLEIDEAARVYFAEEYLVEEGRKKTEELLKQEHLPTAIVAASDILAAGVLNALYKAEIKVPQDISVVGYDDTIAEFLSPPLTTVHVPVSELALASLENMVDKLRNNGQGKYGRNVVISPYLVERESLRRIKGGELE